MAKRPARAPENPNAQKPLPAPAVIAAAPMRPPPDMQSFGDVPEMTSGMTFREIGQSGLRAWSGYVKEEFLPNLQGRQGTTAYREMLDNSPIVGGVIQAITATMRKVTWRVRAPDDTPENQEKVEFAESLMEDMSHTWEDAIIESLSMLGFGYAPLEIVYKKRDGEQTGDKPSSKFDDGYIGWRRLPVRGQDTVLKWFLGPNGEIQGLTQQPYVGPIRDIPIEKLLLFRPSQHKNNPEGRSILRNSYRSYFFIKRIEEQEAILYERLNGLPVIRVPQQLLNAAAAGDAPAQARVNAYKRIAVNLRIDDQMGLVLPSDTWPGSQGQPSDVRMYDLELITPGGGSSGATGKSASGETLLRHSTNIMLSVLADFLQLGHGQQGTQSLSVNKTDMFFQAIEGYLNTTAAVFNRFGLPRLWRLNGWDMETMPTFEPDLAARMDLEALGSFISSLSGAGMMMFPNPELEAALLDIAGLPDIDEDTIAEMDLGREKPEPVMPGAVDPKTGKPVDPKTAPGEKLAARLLLRGIIRKRKHSHAGEISTKKRGKRKSK